MKVFLIIYVSIAILLAMFYYFASSDNTFLVDSKKEIMEMIGKSILFGATWPLILIVSIFFQIAYAISNRKQ